LSLGQAEVLNLKVYLEPTAADCSRKWGGRKPLLVAGQGHSIIRRMLVE
jgi:hypothetical protein